MDKMLYELSESELNELKHKKLQRIFEITKKIYELYNEYKQLTKDIDKMDEHMPD